MVCRPFPFQVLGSNLVLEDLKLSLALSLVQLSQSQGLIQLQSLTTQRYYLVHLQSFHPLSVKAFTFKMCCMTIVCLHSLQSQEQQLRSLVSNT